MTMKRVINMFELDVFFEENKQVKNSFEQLDDSFKFSLGVNPRLRFEISNVYERTLNNYARFILGGFQLTLFEKAEQMIRLEDSEEIEEFINRFTLYMNNFFDNTYKNINFNTVDNIEELKYILTLGLLLINDAYKENDVELAFEAFYQTESRIKREFPLSTNFLFDSNLSFNIRDEIEYGESFSYGGK